MMIPFFITINKGEDEIELGKRSHWRSGSQRSHSLKWNRAYMSYYFPVGSKLQLTLQLLTIKPDGHGAIIQQFNFHICTKYTRLDFDAVGRQGLSKALY